MGELLVTYLGGREDLLTEKTFWLCYLSEDRLSRKKLIDGFCQRGMSREREQSCRGGMSDNKNG